jgi:hypothetical protein
MGLRTAPTAREGDQRSRFEPLARKDNEAVVVERRLDARECRGIDGATEIDSVNAGTEDFGDRLNPYFNSSGAISRGRISGISGKTMIAASISSIGTSMIIVSLSAKRIGTLATEQAIIRHSP